MKNFKRKKYSRSGKDSFERSLLKSTFPNDYDALKTKHLTIIKEALQSRQEFQKSFEFFQTRLAEQNLVIVAKCLMILENCLHSGSEDLNREASNLNFEIPQEGDPKEQFRGQTIPIFLELIKLKASILYQNTSENLSVSLFKKVSFISSTLSLFQTFPETKTKLALQIIQSILNQGSDYHKTILLEFQRIFEAPKGHSSQELREFVKIIQEFSSISSSFIENIEAVKTFYRLQIDTPKEFDEFFQRIHELEQSEIWNTELISEAPLCEISTNISDRHPKIDIEEMKKQKMNYIMNGYRSPETPGMQNEAMGEALVIPQSPPMQFQTGVYMPNFYPCYPNMRGNIPAEYPANIFQPTSFSEFSRPPFQNPNQMYNRFN